MPIENHFAKNFIFYLSTFSSHLATVTKEIILLLSTGYSACMVFTETVMCLNARESGVSKYLLIIHLNFVTRNVTKFLLLGLTPYI